LSDRASEAYNKQGMHLVHLALIKFNVTRRKASDPSAYSIKRTAELSFAKSKKHWNDLVDRM